MSTDIRHLPTRLGVVVRKSRIKLGISQIDLAERADLNFNYVGSIERGEKLASVETLARLGQALGRSGSDLLREAGY